MRELAPTDAAGEGRVRRVALEALAELRGAGAFGSDVLARRLRAARELRSAERRLVAETVYGVVRLRRRLDFLLDAGAARPLDAAGARDLARYLAYLVEAHGLPPARAAAELRAAAGLAVDFGALADAERHLAGVAEPLARAATRLSVPDWLLRRLQDDLGPAEAEALCAAMNARAPLCVRANRLRTRREALVEALASEGVTARPTALAQDGLVLETRVNVFGLRAFRDGLLEVQDEGSQLVAELVAPPPRGTVLDACAGAGGKTLALAAALGGKGRIVALDVRGAALDELRRRLRRAGATNARAVAIAAEGALPPEASARVDRVLVDAPCSGLGVLRRNPEARWRVTEQEAATFPGRQLAILERFAGCVAEGGRLIYATCTVLRAENDDVIEALLRARPELEVVPVKELWGRPRAEQVGDGTFLRLAPHRQGTDGFFAAVLRRR